jgi:hypothetical protein
MDWRAGSWVIVWLAGLCLISYLGDFPSASEGAGNQGIIGFGWGFVANAVLTVIVYVLALRVRLDPAQVERHIGDAQDGVEELETTV